LLLDGNFFGKMNIFHVDSMMKYLRWWKLDL